MIDDFTRAGGQGWLHAREVSGDGQVELGADEPVVAASVISDNAATDVLMNTPA